MQAMCDVPQGLEEQLANESVRGTNVGGGGGGGKEEVKLSLGGGDAGVAAHLPLVLRGKRRGYGVYLDEEI